MVASTGSLLGGYSWLFALAFFLLLSLLFGVFVYRQIGRLRRNNLRRTGPTIDPIGSDIPQKVRQRIDAVQAFRLCQQPNFTDCAIFGAHAESADRFRMIALDEIGRDLDRQLEKLDPLLRRGPGESSWDYLMRVRQQAPLPTLEENFIARLAFLHEWARYRTDQLFGESELAELRSLLLWFLQILSHNPQLTRIAPPPPLPPSSITPSPKRQMQDCRSQHQRGDTGGDLHRRTSLIAQRHSRALEERQPLLH